MVIEASGALCSATWGLGGGGPPASGALSAVLSIWAAGGKGEAPWLFHQASSDSRSRESSRSVRRVAALLCLVTTPLGSRENRPGHLSWRPSKRHPGPESLTLPQRSCALSGSLPCSSTPLASAHVSSPPCASPSAPSLSLSPPCLSATSSSRPCLSLSYSLGLCLSISTLAASLTFYPSSPSLSLGFSPSRRRLCVAFSLSFFVCLFLFTCSVSLVWVMESLQEEG